MAETTITRRTLRHLAGGWMFAVASIVVFAWLTVGPYVRQNLRPLPGEADITLRECQTDSSCARNAADLVEHQLTLLRQTRTIVYTSAWSVSILAVLAMTIATAFILHAQRAKTAPVLGVVWKVQLGWTVVLLIVHGVILGMGTNTLTETPQLAQMFTFIKAFDSPLTDAGHLYYLAWLAAVGLSAPLITRMLRATD